ncbi:MAG: SIMPL domain-containing protein [Synechococcaceae cyanobacterium]|nr:SIMPL domain-containing protein [Synechococcaceae cyanobacterium]
MPLRPRLPRPSRSDLRRWRDSSWALLRRTPAPVFAMAVLSLGLIWASAVLVRGIRQANDTITVTGASTERITSDSVDWSLVVKQQGSSQRSSYLGLEPQLQRTLSWLRRQGLRPEEIEVGTVEAEREDVRDPRTNELRSTQWTSRRTIRISSTEVARVTAISARVGDLIGAGVPLTIQPPAYTYTRLAEKRVDMLAKATRDARNRARAIAWEAGGSIGAITNAETGTFQITPPNSTETSDSGSYDTSTVDKDITAVMAVTFRVE